MLVAIAALVLATLMQVEGEGVGFVSAARRLLRGSAGHMSEDFAAVIESAAEEEMIAEEAGARAVIAPPVVIKHQSLTRAEEVEASIIMSAETKDQDYRLGDAFNGILCFFEHGDPKRYFKEKFPNSVMDKYFEALPSCYAQCKYQTGWQHFAQSDADGLPCDQQCTVRAKSERGDRWCPAGKEKEMTHSVPTRFEVLASVAKELSYVEETPPEDTLVVHLRLGDIVPVLDVEVDAAFRFDGNVMYQLSQDWVHLAARNYVRGREFFNEAIAQLPRGVTKVVLVGSTMHGKPYSVEPSLRYVGLVEEHFRAHNFKVTKRLNFSPDADFVYIANAHWYLRSGGGFSGVVLAGSVKLNGGTVLGDTGFLNMADYCPKQLEYMKAAEKRHPEYVKVLCPKKAHHCNRQLYRKTFPQDVPGKDGWTTLNLFEVHYEVFKSSYLRHTSPPHSDPNWYAATSSVAECKELCVEYRSLTKEQCHVYQWDKQLRRCILRGGGYYTLRPNAEERFYSGHDAHVTAVTPVCAGQMERT